MSLQWGKDEAALGFGEGIADGTALVHVDPVSERKSMTTKQPFEPNEHIIITAPIQGTGQALVYVDPTGDPRVHSLGLEVIAIVQEAEARVVLSDADVHGATESIALIAGLKKAFEEKRKEYTAPLNGYLKDINAAFKEYTDPLEKADKVTRDKVLAYRAEQERQRQEQERINQLRMEAAIAEMKLKGELTEEVNLVEIAPAPPAHYRSVAGDLGIANVWKWEVEDISKVPPEYIIVDAAKLGKVVRAGLHSIPGIRIWQEEGLRASPGR